jgi:hemerythrin superfamily protein
MAKAKSPPQAGKVDAIALLKADHADVKKMFKQFERMKEEGADDEKSELAARICAALTVHAQIEEEIFYPAVRDAIDDDDLMDEAEVEHAGAKSLISQIESMQPGDPLYDAKVTVLGEQVEHHIKEEEGEMFTQIRESELDLEELGLEMMTRKGELEAMAGMEGADPSKRAPQGDRGRQQKSAG